MKNTAKFLNKNGRDSERADAAKTFEADKEYNIIGGSVHSSCSYFQFEGVRGTWNTVMFDTSWEEAQHLLEHDY